MSSQSQKICAFLSLLVHCHDRGKFWSNHVCPAVVQLWPCLDPQIGDTQITVLTLYHFVFIW
jgi:hypothetical protein